MKQRLVLRGRNKCHFCCYIEFFVPKNAWTNAITMSQIKSEFLSLFFHPNFFQISLQIKLFCYLIFSTHISAKRFARPQAKYQGAGAQAEQLLLEVLRHFGVRRAVSALPEGAKLLWANCFEAKLWASAGGWNNVQVCLLKLKQVIFGKKQSEKMWKKTWNEGVKFLQHLCLNSSEVSNRWFGSSRNTLNIAIEWLFFSQKMLRDSHIKRAKRDEVGMQMSHDVTCPSCFFPLCAEFPSPQRKVWFRQGIASSTTSHGRWSCPTNTDFMRPWCMPSAGGVRW